MVRAVVLVILVGLVLIALVVTAVGQSTAQAGSQGLAFVPMAGPHAPLPPQVTRLSRAGGTYTFTLVRFPDGRCRAYIRSQPSYRERSESLHSTHRLRDSLGRLYVCWRPEPRDPGAMAGVLWLWMDGTDVYRRTGTFPGPLG